MVDTSLRYLLLLSLIYGLSSCVSKRFPLVHPIPESSRYEIARKRAQNYFIKARDYERRGLHQMAEHFYEMAYELDPKSIALRDLLVKKYILSGKYKQALVLVKGQKKNDDLTNKEKRAVSSLYMEMQQFHRAAETIEKCSDITLTERGTLGYIYERLNNNLKAIENYTVYFNESPTSLDIGTKIADLYIKEQMLDKAESLYVFLAEKFEEKTEILNGLGMVNLLKHDTASAIIFFETAIMLDSTSKEAVNNIAQIHIARGEYSKAINYYERMSEDHPVTRGYYRRTLALLYYYDKQYTKAENVLQSLLVDDVDDYELHFYLGLVFAASDRLEVAEIELRKTLALRENYADAWLHLCYLALKQKNWDKALNCAQRFKDKMPEAGAAWRMYGYALNINKQFKEAIEALRKALSFDKNDAVVWFEIGSAYERTGNYEKAADAFRNVLHLKPDDDAAANYLGYMWAEQDKNIDSAKVLLELALRKEPDNGAYLDSYAWIFFKMGDLENAEKYILKAIKQIDDDPIIHAHLGDILSKKGDDTGAIEAYQKSIELGSEDKKALEDKIKTLLKNIEKDAETPVLNDTQ